MDKKMRDMHKIEFMRIPELVNRDDQTIDQETKEAENHGRGGKHRRDSTTVRGFDCETIDSETGCDLNSHTRNPRNAVCGELSCSKMSPSHPTIDNLTPSPPESTYPDPPSVRTSNLVPTITFPEPEATTFTLTRTNPAPSPSKPCAGGVDDDETTIGERRSCEAEVGWGGDEVEGCSKDGEEAPLEKSRLGCTPFLCVLPGYGQMKEKNPLFCCTFIPCGCVFSFPDFPRLAVLEIPLARASCLLSALGIVRPPFFLVAAHEDWRKTKELSRWGVKGCL
ncbi:hypothetical protein Droror1_Dr00006378 [Drosera rotundifolia]